MKAKILIFLFLLLLIMAGIVHERVVVTGDKGLAVDWNANHLITSDVDMDQHSWLNEVIENRVDWPAGPVEGQRVWRSDLNEMYIFDGANWIPHTPGILRGTHYWTCTGANFHAWRPETDDVNYDPDEGTATAQANGIYFLADVQLPHGAVVTGVIVYGNPAASAETWIFGPHDVVADDFPIMAQANINTQDNTINEPIIDNSRNLYWISTSSLDIGDSIWGARITYTLNV